MKFLFLLPLLVPAISFAQVKNLHVENFHLTYEAPSGKGHASHFDYSLPGKESDKEEQNIEVTKTLLGFHLVLSGAETKELDINKAPSFLTEAHTINLENLNARLDQTVFFSMDDGVFQSENDDLELKGFKLNCNRHDNYPDLIDQALTGCVENMSLSTSQFSSDMIEKSLGIKSLKFNVTANDFNLTAEIKAQISGTAKGKGKIYYVPTTGIVSLKLSEVKFGILTVTGQVFDALKKQESDRLQVKEPWIYYKIK